MTQQPNNDELRTSHFIYNLPSHLIAQTPVEPRDHSRLMSLCRADNAIQHHRFYELPQMLNAGDVMVFNDSRVMPARLAGRRSTGGAIELLLLSRISPGVWRAIGRPGRLLRVGSTFTITRGGASILCEVMQVEQGGERIVRIDGEERLHDVGTVPLPPYITDTLDDSERYQTVYSRSEGSAAAPTAGLHFTNELLHQVRAMGVQTVFVTLHIGWGTFRPIDTDDPAEHEMHAEYWELSRQAAKAIRAAKAEGRRVISVGTTAVRLLENAAALSADGLPNHGSGWADIFITPGYRFKVIDALITNFHLPRSTLLMLVSAFADRDFIMRAYAEAVKREYRFYSFGDAMFIH